MYLQEGKGCRESTRKTIRKVDRSVLVLVQNPSHKIGEKGTQIKVDYKFDIWFAVWEANSATQKDKTNIATWKGGFWECFISFLPDLSINTKLNWHYFADIQSIKGNNCVSVSASSRKFDGKFLFVNSFSSENVNKSNLIYNTNSSKYKTPDNSVTWKNSTQPTNIQRHTS